jgi:ATP-grasp domain, R2K clade family 3
MMPSTEQLDVLHLEELLWLVTSPVGLNHYDFDFDRFFACRRPWKRPDSITAIARVGAISDYPRLYDSLEREGVSLIHSPEQYRISSELSGWYPLITDLTPRSMVFSSPPSTTELEAQFEYPVFLKGDRQTSRHNAAFSIIRSRDQYETAIAAFAQDAIMNWQRLVVREFVPLRKVVAPESDKIPPSFEFRTFWWHGQFVAGGAYWGGFYDWTAPEKRAALSVARVAAQRINLPFIVLDLAQTATGDWIVIECNDAQESGYAAMQPLTVWQNILEIERTRAR